MEFHSKTKLTTVCVFRMTWIECEHKLNHKYFALQFKIKQFSS